MTVADFSPTPIALKRAFNTVEETKYFIIYFCFDNHMIITSVIK